MVKNFNYRSLKQSNNEYIYSIPLFKKKMFIKEKTKIKVNILFNIYISLLIISTIILMVLVKNPLLPFTLLFTLPFYFFFEYKLVVFKNIQ